MADKTLNPISASLDKSSIIFDPACGAGNLLISCARRLPLASTLKETLHNWGKQLYGCDLHFEFSLAVKYRLAILAMSRGLALHEGIIESIEEAFPKIRQADGLSMVADYQAASHVIVNPPYTMMNAPTKVFLVFR